MALSILERLKAKTKYEGECWLYIGGHDEKGYGRVRFEGKKRHVNRVSCHLFHGLDLMDITLHALHKLICPNKNCWNPEHLYVGTNEDNVRDTVTSGVLKSRKMGNQKHRRSPVWPRRNR